VRGEARAAGISRLAAHRAPTQRLARAGHEGAAARPQYAAVWLGADRLEQHPQPMPPIYQPEVAGRAVAWAAEHPRREVWVGGSTIKAIVGQHRPPRARRPLPRSQGLRGPADRVAARPRARGQPLSGTARRSRRARPVRRQGAQPQPAAMAQHPPRSISARRGSRGRRRRGDRAARLSSRSLPASASSSNCAACSARRPVSCSICVLQEKPSAITSRPARPLLPASDRLGQLLLRHARAALDP
jgi:hypothetical protein